MAERGGSKGLQVGILFVLLFALLHTGAHVVLYGTGISGFAQRGVSGFSIGSLDLGDDTAAKAERFSGPSRFIILAEWFLLIGLVVFAMVRTRIHSPLDKEIKTFSIDHLQGPSRTDLDVLYDLLKEQKRIPLSRIEKTFKVNQDTVESWCKTLESGNLAQLSYPRIGEPELHVIEP